MDKRYYIFRVDGLDIAVFDDSEKAKKGFDYLKNLDFLKEDETELNFHTTTYNFIHK